MEIFSLSPLRARKSENYNYRDSWKSDNFRERNEEKKQSADNNNKKAHKIKRDNFIISKRVKTNRNKNKKLSIRT